MKINPLFILGILTSIAFVVMNYFGIVNIGYLYCFVPLGIVLFAELYIFILIYFFLKR